MAAPHIRTQIRIPQDLYDKLQESAAASARSFNAEMLVRLESSFRHGLSLEREGGSDPERIQLRPFQQWLLECVRKIVRIEALLGAKKLTKAQEKELSRLKAELEAEIATPDADAMLEERAKRQPTF